MVDEFNTQKKRRNQMASTDLKIVSGANVNGSEPITQYDTIVAIGGIIGCRISV